MAVAEIFLSAFITVLFEKLASADLIKLARSAGILSELEKWKSALFLIQAVLADAGHKHITKIAVQEWLNRLHHLAYDIDDLLDDLATEAMRRQLRKESYASTSTSTNKVFKIIPNLANFTPSNIMYGRKMSSKLDEITTRLHHLVEEKNLLGLNDNVESSNRTYRRTYRRSDETSLVGEVKIVGREADKEALLSELLGDASCNQDVSIVSIVGMGGIGKTTLARDLYNEKKVKDHFELKSWVCVSEKFDVFDISKAVFIDVGGDEKEIKSLNQLHEALQKKLSQKRFLIVLDDVWNENYREWEVLQRPLLVGAPGSKIVVTTRKTKVTSVMDSVQAYPLEVLSKEAALSLFAQHALGELNFDKHPTLKLHAEGIVNNCRGLPLALMTLGRVLRSKTNDEEWAELLTNEIWNLPNDEILPALKLSYYDLPSHLKQLFVYCCLFPKDHIFEKDELVLLWMAEGFLHKSNPNKSMESFGREYFDELESRSFFQQCESGYTMHDLIHDLAISVGGEFFFTLGDKMGSEALEKVHHLSFIRKGFGVYKDFKALQRARRLRTLLSVSMSPREQDFQFVWGEFFLSNKVLSELLPKLQFLRVLSLTDYSIEEVPQSIGCFKHMRYLNFSRTSITCLPDQITGLYNLQSLLVSGCRRLSSLPNSFAKLINLRHLDISNTQALNKMPLGIGELKSLQTLSKVIIEGADGFKISDLKGLLHLRGQLLIEGLEKVVNPIQAKDANLQQRKDLADLELKWSDVFEDSRNKKSEYEVLEGLRPHHNLIKLDISFYGGIGFPSWVGESSFAELTELTLRGCISCTRLPTLGHLRSLKKLFVSSMDEVKTLGVELLTATNSSHCIAFPSLEVLKFEDMQCWEKWSTSSGDNNGTIGSFPRLREIYITNCPKLVYVSVVLIPSLRILHIKGCSEEVVRSMVCVSSSIKELKLQNIRGLGQLCGEVLKHLGAVEDLSIEDCNELRYLWEIESEFLVGLRKLEVDSCKELLSFGEKEEVDSQSSMELVRDVVIYGCKSLGSYRCPNNVERLEIQFCPSITSLTFPFTLKFLSIRSCKNLEESWLLNNILSSLESLGIWDYGNLRSFPEGCFVHLTRLEIWSCDNLESIPEKGFGSLPLRRLEIYGCKNLKSFPHEQLQSLTSLEDLWIEDCPNIDHSFPSGLWPPNLRSLIIGCLKKAMSEWGLLQNYPTSLVQLHLSGEDSGVVSFAEPKEEEDGTSSAAAAAFILPPSLLSLDLYDFENVESVSEGLQHLTRLEQLTIWDCKKVRDLPHTLLPSLSSLTVRGCPKLDKKCGRGKGKYWPIISQIPHLKLDVDKHSFCKYLPGFLRFYTNHL